MIGKFGFGGLWTVKPNESIDRPRFYVRFTGFYETEGGKKRKK